MNLALNPAVELEVGKYRKSIEALFELIFYAPANLDVVPSNESADGSDEESASATEIDIAQRHTTLTQAFNGTLKGKARSEAIMCALGMAGELMSPMKLKIHSHLLATEPFEYTESW